MNKIVQVVMLFILSVLLMACPFSSPYSIDETPQLNIDKTYLGKWATIVTKIIDDKHSKDEPVKIILTTKNDMEYNVAITGYIKEFEKYKVVEDDTIKGSAFLSTAVNRQFLNISIAGRTYLAEIKKENGVFSICPLSDHFTNKMVKSSAALRNTVEFHYNTRLTPCYDDECVLKDLKRVN